MPRKLVSVRFIADIKPIEKSPGLDIAQVDGWRCAVRKGEFKPGEKILFFEIDCFLPTATADPRFGKDHNPIHNQQVRWQGRDGIHVRTLMVGKEAKEISQGIVMKYFDFPEIRDVIGPLFESHTATEAIALTLDTCFADRFGIVKWELLAQGYGAAAAAAAATTITTLGKPPVFFPGTELRRAQNCPNLFVKEKYRDAMYQETVKMDGSSMTVYFVARESKWYRSVPGLAAKGETSDTTEDRTEDAADVVDSDNGRVGICSRNADLPRDRKSKFWEVALRHQLPGKLARAGQNVAIQGELVGSSIQQNRHRFPEGDHEFFVFGIYDIDRQTRLGPLQTEQRTAELGLQHVPVLGYVRLWDVAGNIGDLVDRAHGPGVINGRAREGIVMKSLEDGRQFKVISNKYLITNGE